MTETGTSINFHPTKRGTHRHFPNVQVRVRRSAVHRPLLLCLSVAADQLRPDQIRPEQKNLIIMLALRVCAMAN